MSSPADTTYTVGQSVTADYGCTDEAGGSGVASCGGPVPPGAAINTSTPGTFGFTVTGTDNAGNTASATRIYTVVAPSRGAVAGTQLGRVNVTFAFGFPSATRAGMAFNLLKIKSVPSGSTVVATCKGKGCPQKKVQGQEEAEGRLHEEERLGYRQPEAVPQEEAPAARS